MVVLPLQEPPRIRILLKSDRFNLDDGVNMVLVGVDGAFLKNELDLILWGNADIVITSIMDVELGSTVEYEAELLSTVKILAA